MLRFRIAGVTKRGIHFASQLLKTHPASLTQTSLTQRHRSRMDIQNTRFPTVGLPQWFVVWTTHRGSVKTNLKKNGFLSLGRRSYITLKDCVRCFTSRIETKLASFRFGLGFSKSIEPEPWRAQTLFAYLSRQLDDSDLRNLCSAWEPDDEETLISAIFLAARCADCYRPTNDNTVSVNFVCM